MKSALIFDTSVWIQFLGNKNSPECDLLQSHIEEDLPVFLTPTILQEILQGIRDDNQYRKVKEVLLAFHMLEIPATEAAVGAADLFRSLRKRGATIRKSNDCLIAYYAIRFGVPLVHLDSDFDVISKHSVLTSWKANQNEN
jgi:predicted nucleic acid-binding protein